MSGRNLGELDRWYDVELTYTSNALEGNTLTRNETAIVLEKVITVRGKPLKDHLEAIGHRDALVYVRELATSADPVREADIRNIHRLVLRKIEPEEAGRYSTHQRVIAGSTLVLPSPAEIPSRMGDFADWLRTAPLSAVSAYDAHERLVTIHRFQRWQRPNGQTLMNLLLLKAGYPPLVIRPEDRPEYLYATRIEDRTTYYSFMNQKLEAALDNHLMVLKLGVNYDQLEEAGE